MTSRFIALEGPDGAGKSVQAARLVEGLRLAGHPLTFTREPGGTHLGEQIREVVLNPGPTVRSGEADALLFHAARAQNVREVIRPALARGDDDDGVHGAGLCRFTAAAARGSPGRTRRAEARGRLLGR